MCKGAEHCPCLNRQSQAPSHRLQPFPLSSRCQELLLLQQSMSKAAGTTAPKEVWGRVLAQLPHMPCHHRKTMDHEKQECGLLSGT